MQQWSDFERAEQLATRSELERQLESVTCPTCESQWFEHVEVSQFQADHHVVVGQHVPTRPSTIPYILLRCVRCENKLIPRIIHQTRDIAAGTYDHFLDTLEEKGDSRSAKLELVEADVDKQAPAKVELLGVEFTKEQLTALKELLLAKPEEKPAPKKKTKKEEKNEVQSKEQ